MSLLLPTTELDHVIRFHSPTPIGDGTYGITLRGRPSFVRAMDGFAVFCSNEGTLGSIVRRQASLRERLSPTELDLWKQSDVVLIGNPPSGRPGASIMSLLPGEAKSLQPAVDLLQLAQRWFCSGRIVDDGVAVEIVATTAPTRHRQPGVTNGGAMLAGLPLEPFACAVSLSDGAAIDMHLTRIVHQLVATMSPAGAANAASASRLRAAVDGMLAAMDGFAFSVSGPSPPMATVRLAATARIRVPEASMRRAIDTLVVALKAKPFGNPTANHVVERLALMKGVENAAGVTIDHVVLDAASFHGIDQRAFEDAFGPAGLTLRIGVVDGHYAVVTLGGGLDRFIGVVTAMRSARTPINADPRVIRSSRHIDKSGFLKAYLAVDELERLRLVFAGLLEGGTVQPNGALPAELISVSVDEGFDNGYRIRSFIPDGVLNALRAGLADESKNSVRRR